MVSNFNDDGICTSFFALPDSFHTVNPILRCGRNGSHLQEVLEACLFCIVPIFSCIDLVGFSLVRQHFQM